MKYLCQFVVVAASSRKPVGAPARGAEQSSPAVRSAAAVSPVCPARCCLLTLNVNQQQDHLRAVN